jgi:sec-independent protein translocase protein TatB
MFDIGFSELVVIGIVALVVIGPERLPRVARTAGHLFGRLQRYVTTVKADIAREMELDELRKFKGEMEDAARSVERSISHEVSLAEQEIRALEREANRTIHDAANAAPAESVPDNSLPPPPSPQLELSLDLRASSTQEPKV